MSPNDRRLQPHMCHSCISNSLYALVTIPQGMQSGQNILVQHPSGQVISATIPPGHDSGATFYVRFPAATNIVVAGVPVQSSADDFATRFGASGGAAGNAMNRPHQQQPQQPPYRPPPQQQKQGKKKKYKRCSEEMLLLNKKGLVKIKVPPNLGAGDKMRVQIPDGRMITVTVPPGNVSEFQVKVPPKKQNFHDNPIAVHAPMALGPLMMM